MGQKSRRNFLTNSLKVAAAASVGSSLLFRNRTIASQAMSGKQSISAREPLLRLYAQSSPSFTGSAAQIRVSDSYLQKFSELLFERSGQTILVERTPAGSRADFMLNATLSAERQQPSLAALGNHDQSSGILEKLSWLQSRDTENAWATLHSKRALHPISFGAGGFSTGQFSRLVLEDVSQLKSLKSCSFGDHKSWLDRAGLQLMSVASPAAMSNAWRAEQLDISAPLPHSVNLFLSLQETAPVYYAHSWFENISPYELSFRTEVWEKISEADQDLIRSAAHAIGYSMVSEKLKINQIALDEIRNSPIKVIDQMPESISIAMKAMSKKHLVGVCGSDSLSLSMRKIVLA